MTALSPAASTALGRYRIDGDIGIGPDGPVQRGVAERLGARPVALRRAAVPRGPARGELRRRAETLAAVGHPGLCPVVDIIEVDEEHVVIASELGPHGNLADRLVFGPFPVHDAAAIAADLAGAVRAAHGAGLWHGNLTPTNVVFTEHGPVIADLALPRSGAGRSSDRAALAALAISLIDPADLSPAAETYRAACHRLADDPGVPLSELADRLAALAAPIPHPAVEAPHSARVAAPRPDVDRAAVGLVVAGAAVLGLAIGGIATALPL